MKTLLIVRHAKTREANFGEADFDRTLNDRGERDAPAMAQNILARKIKIDLLVTSPAKRAKQTCKFFAKANDIKKDHIVLKEELYNAPASAYYDVLSSVSNDVKTIAIFGHNPGITAFADSLCPEVHIENMQTGSVFAVKVEISDWAKIREGEKLFLFYDYPKKMK